VSELSKKIGSQDDRVIKVEHFKKLADVIDNKTGRK
jgi:hypothetical protein